MAGVAPGPESQAVLGRPVFSVAGETYRWGDVVVAAQLRGDWAELRRTTAQGLSCLRRLTASGTELAGAALSDAEAVFRRARNLLSGEETIAWLDRRGLSVGEWRDHLRRSVLRGRWRGELDETTERFPADEHEVAAALWAEAVCSGFLETAARCLAGDAALAVESGELLEGEPEQVFPRLAAVAERARADASGKEALEREVASRGLDWLRIEAQLLEVPTENMAREIALCVRDDGRRLGDLAAEAGTDLQRFRVYVCEAEPALVSSLLGANEGDLVGPLERDTGFTLLLIEAKVRPTTDDPEVRRKARDAAVRRATERAIAAHVRWHELV